MRREHIRERGLKTAEEKDCGRLAVKESSKKIEPEKCLFLVLFLGLGMMNSF